MTVWLRLKPECSYPANRSVGLVAGHRCLLSVIRSAGRPFLKTRKRVIGSSRSRSLPIMSILGRTLGPASRSSTFLAVMLTCDIEEQVRRIDSADRVARLKGSDPEGYRHYTLTTQLFVPPTTELLCSTQRQRCPALRRTRS